MSVLPLVGGKVTHLSRCEGLAEESRAFMQGDIADNKGEELPIFFQRRCGRSGDCIRRGKLQEAPAVRIPR